MVRARSYDYDESLSKIARETLWQAADGGMRIRRGKVKSVGVRCYRDKKTFEDVFQRTFGASARQVIAYYAGGRDIHLRGTTCSNVHLFFCGLNTVRTAGAYAILLHESLHRQGIAGRAAHDVLRERGGALGDALVRGSEPKALRARNSPSSSRAIYAPPSYRLGRPNCLAKTRGSEWTAYA